MERLGEILRNTRLEKSLTIEQVEKDTKIRKQYLEAMENEQWDFFSDYIYLKNFLKTYCRYLELDKSEYIGYLISELKPKSIPAKFPEKIDLTNAPHRRTGIFLGIIALVLLFTTSYIYQHFLIPIQDTSEVLIVDENEETTAPGQSDGLEHSESGQVDEVNMINLTLKCLDDRCWVEVKNNTDKNIYQKIIVKGEEINFTDQQKLTIKLGNAGQVQVFVNEENRGVLGEIGDVVTKTYVLENNQIKEL